jgi:hypothetical protein
MAISREPKRIARRAAPGQSKVSGLVISALLPFKRKKTPAAVSRPMGIFI